MTGNIRYDKMYSKGDDKMAVLDRKKTILFNSDQVNEVEEFIKEKEIFGYNFSHFVREAVSEKLQRDKSQGSGKITMG